MTSLKPGLYDIRLYAVGMYLTIDNDENVSGPRLMLEMDSSEATKWELIAAGAGFIVKHKLSGLFATPSGEDIYAKAIVCSKLPAVWRFELDSSTQWNADAYRIYYRDTSLVWNGGRNELRDAEGFVTLSRVTDPGVNLRLLAWHFRAIIPQAPLAPGFYVILSKADDTLLLSPVTINTTGRPTLIRGYPKNRFYRVWEITSLGMGYALRPCYSMAQKYMTLHGDLVEGATLSEGDRPEVWMIEHVETPKDCYRIVHPDLKTPLSLQLRTEFPLSSTGDGKPVTLSANAAIDTQYWRFERVPGPPS